jgi:hypothetical protein
VIPWPWLNTARLVIEAALGLAMEVYYALPMNADPKEGGIGIGLLLLVTLEVVVGRLRAPRVPGP